MSSWYQQSRSEFRQFVEAAGCTWECADCGATDKPLAMFTPKGANPPPLSEIARMLSFVPPGEQRRAVAGQLVCVKCRHARERLATRLAIAGIEQGPALVDHARMGGYQTAPPAQGEGGK